MDKAKYYFVLKQLCCVLMFSHVTESTRYLPMVVWDYLNPLLTCKCNWLTVPKIDMYDQFKFVCPTSDLSAVLLDGISRTTESMNANIYKRKFEGIDEEDFQASLANGSLCNVTQAEKIGTCRDGGRTAFTVELIPTGDKFKAGNFYVYFNNVADGKKESLDSKKVACAMVFAINVTLWETNEHDMTYGKCMSPDTLCSDISSRCKSECNSEPCSSLLLTARSTSATIITPTPVSCPTTSCKEQTGLSLPQYRTVTTTVVVQAPSNDTTPECSGRASRTDFDANHFGYGFIVGCVVCLILMLIIYSVYRTIFKGRKFTLRRPRKNTPVQGPTEETIHEDTNKKELIKAGNHIYDNVHDVVGFNNKNFESSPPHSPDSEIIEPEVKVNSNGLTKDVKTSIALEPINHHHKLPPLGHHNRLPSVEKSRGSTVFSNFRCKPPKENTEIPKKEG